MNEGTKPDSKEKALLNLHELHLALAIEIYFQNQYQEYFLRRPIELKKLRLLLIDKVHIQIQFFST
mgnify:CR=1 FL=1